MSGQSGMPSEQPVPSVERAGRAPRQALKQIGCGCLVCHKNMQKGFLVWRVRRLRKEEYRFQPRAPLCILR